MLLQRNNNPIGMKKLLLTALFGLLCIGASAQIVTSTTRLSTRQVDSQFYAGIGLGISGQETFGGVLNGGWIKSYSSNPIVWGVEAGLSLAEDLTSPYIAAQGGARFNAGNVIITPRLAIGPSYNNDYHKMTSIFKISAGAILGNVGIDAVYYGDALDEDDFLVGLVAYYLF